MFAHYFATRTVKYVLITNNYSLAASTQQRKITVSGKAEARKIAAANSAKPWNF